MASGQNHGSCQVGRKPDRPVVGKYVGLAALERAETHDDDDDGIGGGGLSFGISSWHLRKLADNPWNGGGGYSYDDLGNMTPDQVYHRLCDEQVLKSKWGHRTAEARPAGMTPDAEGYVRGRAEDGSPIKAKIRLGGKSLAARLNEAEEARLAAQKKR